MRVVAANPVAVVAGDKREIDTKLRQLLQLVRAPLVVAAVVHHVHVVDGKQRAPQRRRRREVLH